MPKLHEELEFSICMSTNKTTQEEEEDISAKQVLQTPIVAEQAVVQSRDDEQQRKKEKMKVMVAIDGSEESLYALKWALDLLLVGPKDNADDVATSTGTATLEAPHAGSHENVSMVTLIHVMQPFQNYVLPAAGSAELRKEQEEKAAAILARALEICKDKMIKAETLILRGDPKDMICEATEQRHADLLVVGSRGLGMVKRAFLGSVSSYCAHHAKCPVVIVKLPKESGKQ
ncbi:hypothetical protein L3X38_038464 [Prunus dulcis]|uniref:UspA domain-containing protein n=1 Tax=Prunus dulcis TaxID=3755 RepID=A0AAD4YRH8_PRUDU|nr:hypothetical protein L3X38_038464 [Prunus dulcis]